jgi:uncharacterized protein
MTTPPKGAGRILPVLSGHGVFTGYASLFGRKDQAGDIVMPGAFRASLQRKGAAGIRMLFQHDAAEPVGTWIDLEEDHYGLKVRGRIDPNVQRGRELISLLHSGGLDGLSIGFRTVIAHKDRAANARKLIAIDLWEISLVTFPMLDAARISKYALARRAKAEALFNLPTQTQQQGLN